MKLRFLSIALVLPWLPVQTAIAKTDPLCAPLRAFVESVQPGETHAFVFRTSWGGNFKDSKEAAFFARRCNHFGYGPAKPVCEYLMEHGAIEFSHSNLKRAITCLAPKTRLEPGLSVSRMAISLSYGSNDRGSQVRIEFAEDSQVGGKILRVEADGY